MGRHSQWKLVDGSPATPLSFSKVAQQQTERCRCLWRPWWARPSLSSSSSPLRMSKPKSKTRRASCYINSLISADKQMRGTTLSQTTISRKNPPCTWCFACGVASSGLPSASFPRSTTARRWSAASVRITCTLVLSTASGRSVAKPTNCAPRGNSNMSSPLAPLLPTGWPPA